MFVAGSQQQVWTFQKWRYADVDENPKAIWIWENLKFLNPHFVFRLRNVIAVEELNIHSTPLRWLLRPKAVKRFERGVKLLRGNKQMVTGEGCVGEDRYA